MYRLSCAAVALVVLAPLPAPAGEHTKDKLADVKKAVVDDKAILIDVREETEWKDGHLKAAKHLPLSELKAGVAADKLKDFFPKDKVVYLHCAAGSRCLKAADLLKAAGYDTRPLKPGYDDLQKAGFEKAK